MKHFFNQVKEIIQKYENESKRTGNNFNVFETINVTTDEVRLHSKFIGELLNTKGSHGQNDKYLKIFIDQLNIEKLDSKTTSIEIEKYIGKKTNTNGGIIDIYLVDSNKNSVIIENKIYARDQENQLVRYFNYKKSIIFYLTLYGSQPEEESIGNLKINKDVYLLSYKDDIINWLEECIKQSIEQPLVHSGIKHYYDLIKSLTGQSKNKKMSNEIRDFIALSKDNLKIGVQIQENVTEAKIKIQYLFWKKIVEFFSENEIQFNKEHSVTWDNISSYYKKTRNRDNFYGYWTTIFEDDNYEYYFGIELGNDFYYGFSMQEKKNKNRTNNLNFNNHINYLSSLDSSYKTNEWWLGYKYTTPYLNFKAFNSDEIYSLADRDTLNKVVESIVSEALLDIKSFIQHLRK